LISLVTDYKGFGLTAEDGRLVGKGVGGKSLFSADAVLDEDLGYYVGVVAVFFIF
jgi:hypothetical protein